MDPKKDNSSRTSGNSYSTAVQFFPYPQNDAVRLGSPVHDDASKLLSLCLNKDVLGTNPVEKFCAVECPFHCFGCYCTVCFLVEKACLGKTLPTVVSNGVTLIRMDLSWLGHYLQKSPTCHLYRAISTHMEKVHFVLLPPLAFTQSKGSILLRCPLNTGNCKECSCNGPLCMPADLKPLFYQNYLYYRRNAPHLCSFLVYNLNDNDYKGESQSEININKRKAISVWVSHIENFHSNCRCLKEQVLANQNAITANSPLALEPPTYGSYGQLPEQPTVNATTDWDYEYHESSLKDQATDTLDRAEI